MPQTFNNAPLIDNLKSLLQYNKVTQPQYFFSNYLNLCLKYGFWHFVQHYVVYLNCSAKIIFLGQLMSFMGTTVNEMIVGVFSLHETRSLMLEMIAVVVLTVCF